MRFLEFFAANIRNPHTRRAYARACGRFFIWCERRGLTLATIRPFDVAAWVKELHEEHSTPGVKQQLAAVRMLFDWLITGQVVPTNPAASVRGPKYVVTTDKTPVLDGTEWRKLIDAIPADTVRDLRDRALIVGGDALRQVWLFIVAPLVGGILAALVWLVLIVERTDPTVAGRVESSDLPPAA